MTILRLCVFALCVFAVLCVLARNCPDIIVDSEVGSRNDAKNRKDAKPPSHSTATHNATKRVEANFLTLNDHLIV